MINLAQVISIFIVKILSLKYGFKNMLLICLLFFLKMSSSSESDMPTGRQPRDENPGRQPLEEGKEKPQ